MSKINGIIAQIREAYGLTGDADSYKMTQSSQYPDGAVGMMSYIESRGGKYDKLVMIGTQLLIKEYFLQPITHDQVDNLVKYTQEHFFGNNDPKLEIAFRKVVTHYNGKPPIRIRSAKEGMVIPTKNVLLTIETTVEDEDVFPIVSYFETKLMRIWSPITVATESYHIREIIYDGLCYTADSPDEEIKWKLHDFGSRGISSMEGAAFAGLGHLVSFLGSDTSVAVMAANIAYNESMAGFSIPATEHSTTTSHGRYGEVDLVKKMFATYAKPGAIFATVIDSYNWVSFIRDIASQFKDRLIESGATWVFRPDSGDPVETPLQVIRELDKIFGHTVNSKGYKVLNNVRVIQGDGIDTNDVRTIVERLVNGKEKWSVSNIAFGMGGGLLQRNNRDTLKFAMKCCAILRNGEWQDVYKSPAVFDPVTWEEVKTESFKKSKAGRITLMYNTQTGAYKTCLESEAVCEYGWTNALDTVYENGDLLIETSFSEVRSNAGTF